MHKISHSPSLYSRRQLLKLSVSSLAIGGLSTQFSACTHKPFYNPDEDIFLSSGKVSDDAENGNRLVVLNLQQEKKHHIPLPFEAHALLIHPANKYHIVCFEKNGRQACLIDIKQAKQLLVFESREQHLFSGHACFSQNKQQLYSIEYEQTSLAGTIVVRNSKTFEIVESLPTLGLQPYDCQLLPDNTLVVSNSGVDPTGFHLPSLVFIDMTRKKLLKRLKPDNPKIDCGHFSITPDNTVIVSSASVNKDDPAQPGGISFSDNEGKLQTLQQPEEVMKRLIGRAGAICVNTKHLVAAIVHRDANLLTFWSLPEKRILKAIGLQKPLNISTTLNQNHFLFNYGNSPTAVLLSAKTFEPDKNSLLPTSQLSGSHLMNWSQKIREVMPTQVYG